MSQATTALNIYKQITTLKIIGGVDCNVVNPLRPHPDLYVKGGVYIGKSLCVNEINVDNINVNGNIVANSVCSPLVYVDQLISKTGGVIQIGNIFVMDDTISANVIIANAIATENLGVINNVVVGGTLNVIGNTTLSNVVSDIVCVNDELFVDTIIGKTGAITLSGEVVITGNLIVLGNFLSNVLANIPDPLIVNQLCANIVQINELTTKVEDFILIRGNLIPSLNDTYTLGNITQKFANIFTQDLLVCGDAIMEGSLNVNGKTMLANATVENIIVTNESQFDGNVNIDAKLTVDELCVTGNTTLGNLNVTGTTSLGNVTVDNITITGNLIFDGNINASETLGFGGQRVTSLCDTYTRHLNFVFPGSTKLNVSSISVTAKQENANAFALRVFDVDNVKIVAESTGLTANIETLYNLTPVIANIPADKSRWELHALCTGNSNNKCVQTFGILLTT